LNSNKIARDGCEEEDQATNELGGNSAVVGGDKNNAGEGGTDPDDVSSDASSGGSIVYGDDNTDDTTTGFVFGTAVGGGLFVCLLFVLIALLVRKRRRNNENNKLSDQMKHDHEADNIADATLIRLSSMSNLRLMETYSNLKSKDRDGKDNQKMMLKSKNKQRIAKKKRNQSFMPKGTKVKKEFGQVKGQGNEAAGMVNSNPLYCSSTGVLDDDGISGGDVEMSQMSDKNNKKIGDHTTKKGRMKNANHKTRERRKSLKKAKDKVKKKFGQLKTRNSLADPDGTNVMDMNVVVMGGANPLYQTAAVADPSLLSSSTRSLVKKGSFRAHQDGLGRQYFHCEVTDKVQWEKPEDHAMKPDVTHDSIMDPKTRRHFYVNKETGHRTWTDHDA